MPDPNNPCGVPRTESRYTIADLKKGKVNVFIADRISADDVVMHLVERELYRLAGGEDPGTDVNPGFIDFLVRERFIER
jgi:hypothetical protein